MQGLLTSLSHAWLLLYSPKNRDASDRGKLNAVWLCSTDTELSNAQKLQVQVHIF